MTQDSINREDKKIIKSGQTVTGICAHTGNKLKMYVHTAENHFDNETFKKLYDNIDFLKEKFPYVRFTKNVINASMVQKGKGFIRRLHNSLDIAFGQDCFIRVCPYKDGLEISKVMVHEEHRGKGLGEFMMFGFFIMCGLVGINLDDLPIMLECTGQTGITKSDLQRQTKFFRKFGFRVDQKQSRYDASYVMMNLVNEKLAEWIVPKAKDFINRKENTIFA